MRHISGYIALLFSAFLYLACQPKTVSESDGYATARFLTDRQLVATIESNPTDYFLYRGQPMGFQLDLLESFAAYAGCRLTVLKGEGIEEQLTLLRDGTVDIVASSLNIAESRSRLVAFSPPLYRTGQVLVQLKTAFLSDTSAHIADPKDLAGKEIHVRRHSIFEESLNDYNLNLPRSEKIRIVKSRKTEEELLMEVAKGNIAYTVASTNKASRFAMTHPQIDCRLHLGPPQEVAWALNLQADSLRVLVDRWLDSLSRTPVLDYLYHKYYEIPFEKTVRSVKSGFRKIDSVSLSRRLAQREKLIREGVLDEADSNFLFETTRRGSGSEKRMAGHNRISPFDRLLKKYSRQIPWDWRLLASLVYQESQFQSHLISSKGAIGLMQMMPATARRYHITVRSSDEAQIRAGTEHIRNIYRSLPAEIPEDQQLYFALASYNCGLGHILDARRLAQKYGSDPNIWYDHVETYLIRKSQPQYYRDTASRNGYANGRQTADFVRKIEERYRHYCNLVP